MPRKKKDGSETELKPKKLTPFDIINLIYTCNPEFDNITDKELEKNYYIINDRFGIGYPQHAAFFNHFKANGASVVKCWKTFIQSQNGNRPSKAPYWIYTKGKEKSKEEKKKNNEIPKSTLKEFAIANDTSLREVEFAMELNPLGLIAEINEYLAKKAEIEELRKMTLESMKNNAKSTDEIVIDVNDEDQMSIF